MKECFCEKIVSESFGGITHLMFVNGDETQDNILVFGSDGSMKLFNHSSNKIIQ
jgi:hypothetical protein